MKGYRTWDVESVAAMVAATAIHNFYPCLFYPSDGWFFMSPIPLLINPREEAAQILAVAQHLPFDCLHPDGGDYTEEFWLEIAKKLTSGSILSVYTFLQSDALDEILYVNEICRPYVDTSHLSSEKLMALNGVPTIDYHPDKSGIQFQHYHPGNHIINGSHMCFGLPNV